MTLWQKNDGAPQSLPFQDAEADGTVWTDLANNPEGRQRCGWAEAPPKPEADPGCEVIWVNGAWAQSPLPPPPRRELPKLTVQARLKGLGRLAAAWSALQADPDKFGRWFLDGLNVYADDPDLLAMLSAIGCTADEIAQVTA